MHAYALINRLDASTIILPNGIQGALELVSVGALSAVVEPHLELEVLKTDDVALMQAVLAHDLVICDLFRQTTVLPLRFASFFPLTALQADLQTQQSAYLRQLAELTGKAEYTLKLIPKPLPDLTPPETVKGKDYFLAKKRQVEAQQEQRSQQAQSSAQILAIITQAYRHQLVSQTVDESLTIHLLLAQAEHQHLVQQIELWQTEHDLLGFSLNSGFPPYHFVAS